MADKRIALIVDQYGSFQVRTMDEDGYQRQVGYGENLEDCLRQAAMQLGHHLVIPVSGPDSVF